MPTDISKASNDKLVKYYFTLEAARWEDAAGSPNGRKLYEYYCFKRQFDKLIKIILGSKLVMLVYGN